MKNGVHDEHSVFHKAKKVLTEMQVRYACTTESRYIIDDTLSTKLATVFAAFIMFFLVLLLLEFMLATVPATTLPTAIATPMPLTTLVVFFFILFLPP